MTRPTFGTLCMYESLTVRHNGIFFQEYSATILYQYQVSLMTRVLPYKGNQEQKERLRDYFERTRQVIIYLCLYIGLFNHC